MKEINRNYNTMMDNMKINMNIKNHMVPINLIDLSMMERQKVLMQRIKENMVDTAFSKSMKIMQKANDKTVFVYSYFLF